MHLNPERVSKSIALTSLIQKNMIKNTGAKNLGTKGASFESYPGESAMPGTLLELGFISNSNERQKLVSNSYQNKLAKAIADGVSEYYTLYY